MREKRHHATEECTRAAMRLVTAHGSGVGATARHLGRNAQRLSRWTRAAATTPPAACPGNGRGSPAQDA
jgi:hypothetical protein